MDNMKSFKAATEEYQQAVKSVKKLIIEAWPRMALVLAAFALMNVVICVASKANG